ncbi:hypothetical protein Poly30_21750 [Planctomycetes bacterium Poly30]|uniref:Uncharacterized protein n=1 Tax=Saltatorellus ferox TaxID=2528018 RepID=A0A518ERE3_9BACT|nr:hypothetical protein Poly30_21750 [Planctomycetes bacterium Poly30]
MISKSIAVTCALGALFTSNFATAPTSQVTDPQVVALQAEVEALTRKVESFEKFLTAQEKAGKELEAALTKSEAEGFTAGINPGSREILLKGLRAQAAAMQAGGGSSDDEQPEDKGSMRGRRRGSIK